MKFFKGLFYATLLLILILKFCIAYDNGSNDNDKRSGEKNLFDFIIVGGGTAGCVIARRLSETGKYSVLLVEIGLYPHPEMEIPLLSIKYRSDPNYTKGILSIPQSNLLERTTKFMMGSVLGGGSAINSMILNRGNPQDYDTWARLTEDDSWSYIEMLKYFRKYENYLGLHPSYLRGVAGPLTVTPSGFAPGLKEWLNAAEELGFDTNTDQNAYQKISFVSSEYTKNEQGKRVSSFYGYVRPILDGSVNGDLSILTKAKATKIIFDKNKKATAVEILVNSSNITVYSRKEIIVTAGVMGSPILLQKSGIGPMSWLEKENIPIISELPVGHNLQEHIQIVQPIIFSKVLTAVNITDDQTKENYKFYNETGKGPYSSTNGCDGQAFLKVPQEKLNMPKASLLEWPNIVMTTNYVATPANLGATGYTFDPNDLQNDEVRVDWRIALTRPKSRGFVGVSNVTTDGNNEDSSIFLDFQFLSYPDELQSLVEALKFAEKLCKGTKALKKVRCRLPKTPFQNCRQFTYRSEEYWKCYIENVAASGSHAAGSCRMGKGFNDVEAVVNSQLKVIGVIGLRVCDASIMPVVTNANTQGAVYAIAEKAAELILNS